MNYAVDSNVRLALLTPYTGDNLGDGAIQDAVIAGIVKRLRGAQIYLVALSPRFVSQLHKVPGFPITGLEISAYSKGVSGKTAAESQKSPVGFDFAAKARIKLRSGFFGRRLLRPIWHMLRGMISIVRMIPREILHLGRCYNLVRRMDLLVVSGGGQVDDYWGGPMGHPYALFKWALLAKIAGVKFVFLSVGVCTLDSKFSAFFMRNALKLAEYRSFRDHGSKQLLAGLGFTHCDRVTPDLAFSYPFSHVGSKVSSPAATRPLRVGISPIAYLSGRWPKEDNAVFSRYAENLALFAAELLRRGCEITLFATDAPDREVVKLLLNHLQQEGPSDWVSRLRGAKTLCVQELFAELAGFDCVVASRLHGVILSHLALKPVLAISYDRKVTRHMWDMEQEKHCLDIHNFNAGEALEAFDVFSLDQEANRATIQRKVEGYRQELMSQYDELVRSLRHEVGSQILVRQTG